MVSLPRIVLCCLVMVMMMMMLQRHVAGHGGVVAVDRVVALAGGGHGVADACSLCRTLCLQ